jgi:tetratricopeptide (TPR) repeat protein
MNKQAVVLALVIAALGPTVGRAQRLNPMNAVIKAYEQGYYQEVIAIGEAALSDTAGYSRDDVVYLRTYLAFSLVALGQEAAAQERFKQILTVRPKLELNPEFVSPKIIEVFKRAQIDFFRTRVDGYQKGGVLFEQGRPGKLQGLWRSALWPGWGQSARGDGRKGRILKWGGAGVAAGTGLAFLGTYLSHQSYLDASAPGDIESRYDTYNRWYRTRNFTVNLALSFWAYNLFDLVISN